MRFIEMSGKRLLNIIGPDEIKPEELKEAGVTPDSLVVVQSAGRY